MNKFERLRAARAKRAQFQEKAQAIFAKADTEKRGLTAEELTQVEGILNDAAKVTKEEIEPIEREIEAEARSRQLGEEIRRQPADEPQVQPNTPERRDGNQGAGGVEQRSNLALRPMELRALTPEQRQGRALAEARAMQAFMLTGHVPAAFNGHLRSGRMSIEDAQALGFTEEEHRNFLTSPGASGGFLVSPLLQSFITTADKQALGMIEAGCDVIRTQTGADLPYPLNDDTAAVATILGEGAAATLSTSTFGVKVLKTFKYTTGYVPMTFEIMQDSAFDLMGFLSGMVNGRMARAMALHHTTGDGTTQPEGVLTAINAVGSNAWKSAAGASAITSDDLWDLQLSVDPVIRTDPMAKYMMSDTIFGTVMKLKDSQNNYIFREARTGAPATIHGKPYSIVTNLETTIASGKTTVLFGNPKAYKARLVQDLVIFRNDFEAMRTGQVTFYGFARAGGGYVNPSTNAITQPIKGLRH